MSPSSSVMGACPRGLIPFVVLGYDFVGGLFKGEALQGLTTCLVPPKMRP